MNAFSADDFGDVAALLRALGLVGADGEFVGAWIADPGAHLKTILSDDGQREALIDFVAAVRDGQTEADASDRTWLEILAEAIPGLGTVRFYLVLDAAPAGAVRLFLGVRLDAGVPATVCRASLLFPLFRVPKPGPNAAPDAELIGQTGGVVELTAEFILSSQPPRADEAALAGLGLRIALQTAAGADDPVVGLSLSGLQLPGETNPRDLDLSLTDPDALQDAGIELILALLQAQINAAAGDAPQVRALARLLGIDPGSAIPALPVEDILARGGAALTDWLAATLGAQSVRAAWLAELARLLGNGTTVTPTGVSLPLGAGLPALDIRIGAVPGSSGRPVVTLGIGLGFVDGSVSAAFTADLLRLDLGSGDAVALPALSAQMVFDLGLNAPNVAVDALAVGLGLDSARRPLLLLELRDAVIFSTSYDRLDLTSPDAVAAAGAAAVGEALDLLIAQLGPSGQLIAVALGWRAPPGAAADFPVINVFSFLADPLGELRAHWQEVLANRPADLGAVLAVLREILTGTTGAVPGTGTDADPWLLPLDVTTDVALALWQPGSDKLCIGASARFRVDQFGARCTVLETRLRACLVTLDFAAPTVSFLDEVRLHAFGRARGGGPIEMQAEGLTLRCDHIGFRAAWSPGQALTLNAEVPAPSLSLENIELPLDVPDLSGGFDGLFDTLTGNQWQALEQIAALVARQVHVGWIDDLIAAFHWLPEPPITGGVPPLRLSLQGLFDDPGAELRRWMARLVTIGGTDAGQGLRRVLQPLGRLLSGQPLSGLHVAGRATVVDPLRLSLQGGQDRPALALWLEPDIPIPLPDPLASLPLRRWRPGEDGLTAASLSEALVSEFPDFDGWLPTAWDAAAITAGLGQVADLWSASDGMVVPPGTAPAAVTLHLVEDAAAAEIVAAHDVARFLRTDAPDTIIVISTVSEDTEAPTLSRAPDSILDLREPGRDPLSFAPLPNAAGLVQILLAPRADAMLAAGDPDGVAGQAARLAHVLPPIAARPGAVVLADPASGHAAWLALDQMGDGLDRLILVGTPLAGANVPTVPGESAQEMIARLVELLPDPDPADPDDAAIALARRMLAARVGPGAIDPAALALPVGWTGTKRASLAVHLVHGVVTTAAVNQALTATIAAGLSLRAQGRAVTRQALSVTGAGLGLHLPVSTAPAEGGLRFAGHVLAELIGTDLDLSGTEPTAALRAARRAVGHFELRREGGWLIGGPSATSDAGLALRAIEIHGGFAFGGATSQPDRFRMILHGLRIGPRAFPRLEISASVAEADVGIDGLAAPSTPEVAQVLSQIMAELDAAPDATLGQLASLLRGAGILGSGGSFDPLSLSRWTDNPAARLAEALATPALAAELHQAIAGFLGAQTALSFDPAARQLTVSLDGTTGEDLFLEWTLSSAVTPAGVTAGSFRLGRAAGPNLAVSLAPAFTVAVNLDAGLPGVLSTLPIWPAADISPVLPVLPPLVLAHVLSRGLQALRFIDPASRPVIDAPMVALGLLPTGDPAEQVTIPPRAFIDPVGWLSSSAVLGQSGPGGPTLRADRVIALMDAMKPFLGVTGPSGQWNLTAGLALRTRDAGGAVLELLFDPAAFQPGSALDVGGSFGLGFGAGMSPRPEIAAHVGLSGGAPGVQAVHLTLSGTALQVFLQTGPGPGNRIGIYPSLGSLSDLGQLAVAALPAALDAIVDSGGDVGTFVADLGDALALRTPMPGAAFDAAAISAWANDPAAALAARWPDLVANGLTQLNTLLPGTLSAQSVGSALEITLSDVPSAADQLTFRLEPTPLRIEISAVLTGLPVIQTVSPTIAITALGLDQLTATVGPALIDLGNGLNLRPVIMVDVGPGSTESVSTGLGLSDSTANALLLRYSQVSESFTLEFDGTTAPDQVAAGIMALAIDLLGAFVVTLPEVDDVLGLPIGTGTIRSLLTDVVLRAGGGLDPEFFQVIPLEGQTAQDLFDDKLDRIFQLIENLADAGPSVTIDGAVEIGLGTAGSDGLAAAGGAILGLRVGLADRFTLVDGDIALWLENDNRWIIDSPGAGLFIGFLDTNARDFAPLLRVDGLGIRIGRTGKPLVESPITLGSIALHVLAQVGSAELLGGAQVQLSEIAVAVGGASGGNPVAQGILADSNDGESALAPAFSPALSIQSRPGGGAPTFRFRAGDGDGPWWLPIRSQFGPLYVDQVGLGTQENNDQLQSISFLFDGNVSIAGLRAAVEELEIRHTLGTGDFFSSEAWDVDLAGLAVSADLSGVTLAGGLRKFTSPPPPGPERFEYIGMLTARFATYGLSIYGGYAREPDYTAFFAFGAVVGPFGGPPAFFLTGIGGGFGINREIVPPTDLGQFNQFPLLAALDPSFSPPANLLDYLSDVRGIFPPKKGQFWFAAGISFTSFALVDGIAVVAVEFGDGFELTIFGLARMALPRPEVALLSIELGLIARFSSSEGVIWIQAQLTDNSWLFHPSARLTGGFAYVSWFKGPNRGQFVLTLGGYHPDFHADGYPVVPRLGWNWSPVSNITVKSETYYALTSEAMMAGGLFEASAKFGAAYAHLSFGGNAIVYFDPFSYKADAHARVSAGIRIKTIFGTIKLSFTLGASIEVEGPEFNGRARIEVGPIGVTVRFGDNTVSPVVIDWTAFAQKYLELATGTSAAALSSVAGQGTLPPASGSGEESGTADGSASKPFDVLSEFDLSLTSTIPITHILIGTRGENDQNVAAMLGLAPMQRPLSRARLSVSIKLNGNGPEEIKASSLEQIIVTPRKTGRFPKGVWGEAPLADDRKIPGGKVISATEGVDLAFRTAPLHQVPDPATGGIAFNQVEAGPRKPLPLRPVGALISELVNQADAQRTALTAFGDDKMPLVSDDWLDATAREGAPARAARRGRITPMRIGLLSERIVKAQDHGKKKLVITDILDLGPIVYDPPRIRGVLTAPIDRDEDRLVGTTIGGLMAELGEVPRRRPPVLNPEPTRAPLLRADTARTDRNKTLLARSNVPLTAPARQMLHAGARAGAADRETLRAVAAMMAQADDDKARTRALAPGELAVFDMPGSANAAMFPDAGTFKLTGDARLMLFDAYGKVLARHAPAPEKTSLPKRTAMVAIIAGDTASGTPELRGWMAGSRVAYLGRSLALCVGGHIRAEGATRSGGGRRGGIGWMAASELTDQSSFVSTVFEAPARSVAILVDGEVSERELSTLALAFEGAETTGARPILAPYGGKTLVVTELKPRKTGPLGVHLGGLTADRIDGVLAADLSPDRMVTRFVAGNAAPRFAISARRDAKPVRFTWTKPRDIPAPEPAEN